MNRKLVLVLSLFLTAQAAVVPSPRLTNGDVAREGQFPWHVGVTGIILLNQYYCSGAFIGDQWVLTAAHCLDNADSVSVIFGSLNLTDGSNTIIRAERYYIHDGFNPTTLENDIGVLLLEEPLTSDEGVQPIALAEDELQAGTDVTVSGWGLTSDDDDDHLYQVLRYINVTTIANEDCAAVYGDFVRPGNVCTAGGEPHKNPCQGDGGDPVVVYQGGEQPVHVALFSFLSRSGCDSGDPAGYTRTAYYRDWIRSTTGI